ncbi:PDR/VanB family oxidoreductase [Roseibium aggregatum]|uniref:Oxidoreductase n=1 Tax=Roseibium aggregatum TaxID=187304 RepID=A0A939EFN6_9HYPH|nr:PDR/VanB family oxidoreductase [Roseibium aggregatum]MBN9672019.1 oxidoreductase [Roseibium aggregatum]
MPNRLIMRLSVQDVRAETPDVIVLSFSHPRRPELPAWSAGAHVDVHLPDGSVRQYSLCGDPQDRSIYTIAVKREPDGRGGSLWLHETAAAGLEIPVSAPRNHFSFHPESGRHVLVAGGIGITPLAPMAKRLVAEGQRFVLHYCAKSRSKAPFFAELEALCGSRLRPWFSEEGTRFDPLSALTGETGSELYVCGPQGLIASIEEAASKLDWPNGKFHMERFTALANDTFVPEPFKVVIASSGKELDVPEERTLLSVLRENGFALHSSCETGTCGSCECGYREGDVLHRDVVLTPDKQKSRLMPCVSRGKGTLVLDL